MRFRRPPVGPALDRRRRSIGSRPLLALALVGLSGCLTRCGDNSFPSIDGGVGGDGGPPGDGAPPPDAAAPLTFVDFAAGGCVADAGPGCAGPSPLALQFAPLTPAPVDVYLWDFGDGERSSQPAPDHVYRDPGSYAVSLDVEGPGGAVGVSKQGFVTVLPAPLGARCESDGQCASGLCVCGDGDGACPAGLGGRGICAATCDGLTPCAEGVCTDLAPASPSSPEDWQRSLCLPDCAIDPDCPGGLTCQPLRLAGDPGWESVCFAPGVLAPIGASCAGGDGLPDPDRCASGECLGEGARDLCAYDCSAAPCPAGSDCASFNGGLGEQCLARCELAACDLDPWLACEVSGGAGAKGFTVATDPDPTGYCAPRTCAVAADCGTEGECTGGFCAP